MTEDVQLHVEPAQDSHQGELARFGCWSGSPDEPWAEEAENYIRARILDDSENVLLFRTDDAQLAAVSGFSSRWIEVPLLEPERHPGWQLDIIGVASDLQGAGIGTVVLRKTFDEMRESDTDRVLVTANAHKNNAPSIRAAEKVGLTPLVQKDEWYWTLLAEI